MEKRYNKQIEIKRKLGVAMGISDKINFNTKTEIMTKRGTT